MLRPRPLLLAGAFAVAFIARAATFTITYNTAPAEAQTAIQYSANIWSSILTSPVPIKLLVNWFPLGSSTLAITFPNGRRDFPSAPMDSTWYATSLANSIAGSELNLGENDIEIWINSGTNWYYGTDGMPGAGQYDLVSIALHEMCHGLGFVGLSKKISTTGSFGLLQASDFSPLFTTFPWPQLDTLPSVFDRHLENSSSNALIDLGNPSTPLGSAFTSNQVYFSGALANVANGGSHVRIYAPSTWALGSSCVHLNEATFPVGNVNELMTPFSAAHVANHWPGPVCLAILRDIGWTIAPDVGIAEETIDDPQLICYPDPATTQLWFALRDDEHVGAIVINDITGRSIIAAREQRSIDVSALAQGTYAITMMIDDRRSRGKFVKR